MSAEVMSWHDEHLVDHRRRLRKGTLVSVAIHGLVFGALVISPAKTPPPLREVLSVDLVAAPPAAAPPKPVPAPAEPPPAPKPPEAAPKPPPPAPPKPPPIAKAPVQVLPENAPSKIKKVEPKRVDPRLRPKPKEFSYEDAMAALDDELGPEENPDLLKPPPEAEPAESTGAAEPKAGIAVSKEMLEWARATTRRIQNNWKGVSSYEGRGLATTLELELSARGDVMGTPEVVGSSGDPYFDDNAVRAVMMVSPLPAPPRSGKTIFVFRSEGD